MDLAYNIRSGVPSDHPFVYSSWLKSLRQTPPWLFLTNKKYFEKMHDVIEYFLSKNRLLVASAQGMPDDIRGWVLASPSVVQYVYVKQGNRRLCMAENLVKASIGSDPERKLIVPFITRSGEKLGQFLVNQGIIRSFSASPAWEVFDAVRDWKRAAGKS